MRLVVSSQSTRFCKETGPFGSDAIKNDEVAIEQLLAQMADAWNRGDAKSYGARYLGDATFTNVNGAFFVGKGEFDCRHEEIFRGVFQGTKLNLSIKTLRFVRSDVAIADIDAALIGYLAKPPGVNAGPDGVVHACLLMVLLKQNDSWWIAAYHNVWRSS